MAAAFALTLPEAPLAGILAGALLVALVLPVACYPLSRTLWVAMHLGMQPLEPAEHAEAAAVRFERGDALPAQR